MKTIFFPGYARQTCQAQYSIALQRTDNPAHPRTEVLFVEDVEGNHGGTFCSAAGVPAFLVQHVLAVDLKGCRLDFIDVFYAGLPDECQRRAVRKWNITPDLVDFARRGGQCDKTYANPLDAFKAKLGFQVNPIRVETNSFHLVGGSCQVLIEESNRPLNEEERMALLQRFDVLSR